MKANKDSERQSTKIQFNFDYGIIEDKQTNMLKLKRIYFLLKKGTLNIKRIHFTNRKRNYEKHSFSNLFF